MTPEEFVGGWLAGAVAIAAEAVAIVVIAVGVVQAVFRSLSEGLRRRSFMGWRKQVWSELGMWLLLGLQFALAGDIVRSASAPTWTEIGQLAAIAAVRSFLGYFLERDLRELRQAEREVGVPPPKG